MSDRRVASTITVGGATNAGTFEAAALMASGMSAREATEVLFEQNLVVAGSESTRRRLASATTKHLSFLEGDSLRFVAGREYGWELVMWLALVTESYVFAACAREVAWPRLVVDEAPLTSSDIDEFVDRQRGVDPAMSTLTVKSGQKVRSVFLRCLRDVGFIDQGGAALPIIIPMGVARLVNAAPRPWGWAMRESFPVAQFQFDVLD
ncbi:hypothetical protein HMPREF2946_04775 [Actinomyces sp. HMSC062G12]|nr:hypothetical protein HMPREF2946_04775 [Actinomyces sp. HMSC062G12]